MSCVFQHPEAELTARREQQLEATCLPKQTRPRPRQATKSGILNNSSPCLYTCVARPIHENRTQSHNGNPVVARLTTGLVIRRCLRKDRSRTDKAAASSNNKKRHPEQQTPLSVCLCRETRTQSHNGKPVVARLTTTTGLVIRLSLAKEAAQTRPRPRQTTKNGILNNSPHCFHVCSRDLCRETRTQSHNGKPVATSHYRTRHWDQPG